MQIRLYVYTMSTLVNPKKQTIGIRRKANAEFKLPQCSKQNPSFRVKSVAAHLAGR